MRPGVAVIGGTGLYRLLDNADDVVVDTPYGRPSAPIAVGQIDGRHVAFLPRHGADHTLLPADIPYRANLWALRHLGARQVIGVNAVGSLRPEHRRGDLVLTDQFVDRTWGRPDTFCGAGTVAYVGVADPYCSRLRTHAYRVLSDHGHRVHPTGTVVVIQGPRFSTRAESRWFSGQGWDLVNMTQYPEVVLARELDLCYLNLCYVTDHDAGLQSVATETNPPTAVTHREVLDELRKGEQRLRDAVAAVLSVAEDDQDCVCRSTMADAGSAGVA